MRRRYRESPLNTNTIRNLSYGKSSGMAIALTLDHIAFKALDPLFISFLDLIVNGNIVAGFEARECIITGKLLVYKGYSRIHNINFKDGEGITFTYYRKENSQVR